MAGENVLITDHLINFLFSPFGLILFIICGMVFMVLYFINKTGGMFKDFKAVPLNSILNSQYNSIIKVTKISGNWGSLRKGSTSIAKIVKAGVVSYTTFNPKYKEILEKNKKKDHKTKANALKDVSKYIEKDLYVFKLSFNPDIPIMRTLMDLTINKPKFAVVEKDKVKRIDIDKNNTLKTYFLVDPKASVFSFGDIFVYGYYSLSMTQDLAWNYGREREKEELVNYPKKVVHLEASHSKRMDTFEKLDELQEKKFDKRFGNL